MKLRLLALPCLLLSMLLPVKHLAAAPGCLPEAPAISACIDDRFKTFWQQQGGLAIFGYPLAPAGQDQAVSGAPLTQRFERTWFELHPENPAPYNVLLGRAGADVLAQKGEDWTTLPKAGASLPHFVKETGHAVAPEFWDYWSSHGLEFDGQPGKSFAESLALFGFPITEPRMETNSADGKRYLVQWFERARFEYHPEYAGTPSAVLLGLLGREHDHTAPANGIAASPPASLPAGGFIQVSGSQLTRLGQPVQLKGVNYYPQGHPWTEMWDVWDGGQVTRELTQGRDQLGINAVRVLLPFDASTAQHHNGQIAPDQLARLRELIQIVGSLQLRAIVTLFDFDQGAPARGSADEDLRLTYLRSVLGNFVGDDRIIAWDIHNEPDQYDVWKDGDPATMLDWLGRLADVVHHDAPNHLVTVGMSYYENLLRAGPDGRRPIDYSDMVSVHSYNSPDVARELDVLRGSTGKPLVLEEFGWPTGITCLQRSYDEAQQVQSYTEALQGAAGRAAGVFAWTLRDYDAGPTGRVDTREEHYGLYRPDNSLKPAADPFRAYIVPLLPSGYQTNLPLTATDPISTEGSKAPLLVAGSGHYVKGEFRRAWDFFGGASILGPPITEVMRIPGDVPQHDRIVQYYTAGALEYHPEANAAPDFAQLELRDKVRRLVVPLPIGTIWTAGHVQTEGGHAVADIFSSFYHSVDGTWRLGSPITGKLTEILDNVPTPVQYFENGKLQLNPHTGVIEFGNLGELVWQARCASAP